ncbi:MAG: hypothetical protein V3U92_14460 [Cellulophaga sp.]
MKYMLRLFSWKACLILSLISLISLSVLDFYGLYTDKFYFFKIDNYIFPILSIIHFIYLYVFWFKISERELPDPNMRNVEYALYIIFLVYIFKGIEATSILLSYKDFANHIIPSNFLPVAILIVGLHVLLLLITLISFKQRKELVGSYDFDAINDQIDSWD